MLISKQHRDQKKSSTKLFVARSAPASPLVLESNAGLSVILILSRQELLCQLFKRVVLPFTALRPPIAADRI